MNFFARNLVKNGGEYNDVSYNSLADVVGEAIADWAAKLFGNSRSVMKLYGDEPVSTDIALAKLVTQYALKHNYAPADKGPNLDWRAFGNTLQQLEKQKDIGYRGGAVDLQQIKALLGKLVDAVEMA
jgi:hypothetical protein